MSYAWVEPFAGAAACALRLVGGRNLTPPVAWMGGKRRYARAILDALGVPDEPPERVVLADAGPWGWVWPLLLSPADSAEVARVLRSWAGEHPRALWQRLAAVAPFEGDPHGAAAQWLWLQARSANAVPCWWDGQRWSMGSGDARPSQPIGQNGRDEGEGGFRWPSTIADRVEAIAEAFARVEAQVVHGDAAAIEPGPGHCYLDPPYQKATGYGWGMERGEVLALAKCWSDAGAVVAVSEAEPLALEGWHHVELTRPGGKPEWLTLSREPARLPVSQGRLFGEPA